MFGLGVPELLFIMVLALIIFGPKRLPQIGRTLGKGMSEFRRASADLQRSINLDLDEPASTPNPRPAQPSLASPTPASSPEPSTPEASSPEPSPPSEPEVEDDGRTTDPAQDS